jgi:CRP-like cAMP-binding protein
MGAKRDLADALGGVGLFSKCTTVQRRTIARHAQITQLPAGIELIKEGEPGAARFVILDGSATVQRDGIEVNQVGPGAYFGEVALLHGRGRDRYDMTVAVIGIRMFRTLLREFSDLAEQLLVALAGQLRAARLYLQQH